MDDVHGCGYDRVNVREHESVHHRPHLSFPPSLFQLLQRGDDDFPGADQLHFQTPKTSRGICKACSSCCFHHFEFLKPAPQMRPKPADDR